MAEAALFEPTNIPRVPPAHLRILNDLTPYEHFKCHKMAPGRRYRDVVVVKAAFELAPGTLRAAPSPGGPIHPADTYWDPTLGVRASVKRAGDLVVDKPGTDVLVTGSARSPGGRATPAWRVAVSVTDAASAVLLRQELTVSGPRRFEHRGGLRGWTITDPEPTTEVPVRYELAYGGAYLDPRAEEGTERWVVHQPNPSGVGFCDVGSLDRSRSYPAPQWQPASHPVIGLNEEVPLAGLGPVARHWACRRRFAGTYDEAWRRDVERGLEERLPPDYPADFDARFFQAAHPSLVSERPLRGDEHVELEGLLAEPPRLKLRLPGVQVWASVSNGKPPWREVQLPLDTVHFDLDAGLVYSSWRLSLPHEQDVRAAVLYLQETS